MYFQGDIVYVKELWYSTKKCGWVLYLLNAKTREILWGWKSPLQSNQITVVIGPTGFELFVPQAQP